MKKKIKKSIALVLLGVTLCGSALTAQAACYSHEAEGRTYAGKHSETHTHTHGGKTCTVTTDYIDYKVYCIHCGYLMATYKEFNGETHSVN